MEQKKPFVEIYLCPFCGDSIDDVSAKCPSCGTTLIEDFMESALNQLETLAIDSSLFICSNCGAFIGVDAPNCNACGAKRTPLTAQIEISAEDDALSSAARDRAGSPEIFLCNNCGAFLSENATECEVCGMNLQNLNYGEDEEEEEDLPLQGDSLAQDILNNQGALFLCNHCGAFVKPDAEQCGICGEKVSTIDSPVENEELNSTTAEEKLSSPGVLFLCDKCGAFMKQEANECPFCRAKKEEATVHKTTTIESRKSLATSVSLEVPKPARTPKEQIMREIKERPSRKIKKVKKTEIIQDCLKLWLKKAVALKKIGKNKEALRALNYALSLSSNDKAVVLEKANLFYECRNYVKAAHLYRQILNFEPENVEVWNKLGNALYHMGNPQESLLCYEKSLSLDTLNTEAMINKGYILMKQEKWDDAIRCIDVVAT